MNIMKLSQRFKLQASHVKFSIIFATLLYVISNALNIDKIAKWFYRGDELDFVALAAYLVFGLCVFMVFFLLLAHRRIIKPLSILMVILSVSVSYFISKYNVAIDSSMILNTIHTDTTEVGQLLSIKMLPYIVFLMVLPILLILFVDITFQSPLKYLFSSFKVMVAAIMIGTVALYTQFNAIHRAGNVSKKYIIHSLVPVNFIRSSISVVSNSIESYVAVNKKEVEITGRVTSQQDLVVVLAVGETSRQKSFSIYGYDRRNTNPVLSQEKDLHLLNGIARKGTTLYALPEIFEKNDVKLPTMVSRMGIDTACYVNYTLYDNCTAVGEIKAEKCNHGGKCYDEDVVPLLESSLESYTSGYKFVVLHLGGGSHGPMYNDRHPPEFQKFKPTCNDADVVNQCTVEQIYNSYDNTILYVDYVVGEIIQKLDHSGVPYVFMYLSDHGESLLEDDRIFHGMPPGIPLPPEQAQVPLIVKSSVPISIAKRDEYLQQDVYDTVLDLFSIETELFDKKGSFIKKHNEGYKYVKANKDGKDFSGNLN
jgi:lipid A ethanolaminephosphotransferase